MKHIHKILIAVEICFVNLLFIGNSLAQLNLGATKDVTAPLITSEFTSFNPGSGYCRFIPTDEYTITLSSGCQIFELYIPGFGFPIEVDCGGMLHVTMGYNQNHYVYFSNVGSSEVLQITTTGTLPVELTLFTVALIGNNVTLNWQTATEVNNYGFDVERTLADKIQWEKLSFVQGHGNSNSPKEYSFTDVPNSGTEFKYRLKQIDFDGKYEYSPEVVVNLEVPTNFSVKQNFPNPFNPTTKIEFTIPTDNNVEIKVFNVLGMEVAILLNEHRQAGIHNIEFNASNLSSGIYFYKVVSGNFSEIKKMVLLR